MTSSLQGNAAVNIDRRLEFMQLGQAEKARLGALREVIEQELPKALDTFYATVKRTPETSRHFSSDQHMAAAKGAQVGHWTSIIKGDFTEKYAANVRAIGMAHARIGLEPQWYIGGYAMILDHLLKEAVKAHAPKNGLFGKKGLDADELGSMLGSLAKAVFLDMDLAISVYVEEKEAALKASQQQALNEAERVSEVLGQAIAALGEKRLDHRIGSELPPAYAAMGKAFNAAMEELGGTIHRIETSASHIQTEASDIHASADHLAKRTEQQAASVEETAAALQQITATVSDSAKRAGLANDLAGRAKAGAQQSGQIVDQAVAAMSGIENSSKEISNIIGVIDEIAFQTNLLALNAGVEAARAGDAGKGFAVVAQEVRELAQRSAKAAKEIKSLITNSGEQVKNGVALVAETGEALSRIVHEVTEISQHIHAIHEAARDQTNALSDINSSVTVIDQGTQQNAAMVEQANAASNHLADEAVRINDMLGEFRTGRAKETVSARSAAKPALQSKPAPRASQPAAVKHVPPRPQRSAPVSIGATALARDNWEEF
ncbi:methyl-accepting chemotaxis protein [Rhizobium sp. SG_E_25_P2]|uniref:globin-coupled sensor protein n=1 Tax=Rhizobium sp. SG_E_25_P2 TaxID=2879942 RepID=UPI0024772265|nr:globin-coupled sensor protein [Rhizobium sp. SG_E_25_P2]MDH6267675.1 methyl-accepting chemotaxis protein [Rhizobium sp. SG_E_25_P2]